MMNVSELILGGTSILSAAGVITAAVWKRGQPSLDKATEAKYRGELKKMSEETNRNRDIRIWQLEGYIDLDRTWHRKIIVLCERLIDLAVQAKTGGFLPVGTVIPTTEDIPSPPEPPEPHDPGSP